MSVLGFYTCLYLTDKPFTLCSPCCICTESLWFPDRLQNRDLLILMISLSLMKAQQRSLCWLLLCQLPFAQFALGSMDAFRGLESVLYVASFLPQFYPLNHVVFLSPLICVSSRKTEASETFCAKWHILICSSCHFIITDDLGLSTCFKSLVLCKFVVLLDSKN